jgi:hypothetical protein
MPEELKCVTPGCQRNAVFRKAGQCKVCYQREWTAKKNGPGKKCACGETIRRDNKIGMCKACKKGDPTPGGVAAPRPEPVEKLRSVEKTAPLPPPWPESGTARPAVELLDGLASFYAGLTVAQLRAHHEALKHDAGRRIREADELKEIAPTAFAQLEVA